MAAGPCGAAGSGLSARNGPPVSGDTHITDITVHTPVHSLAELSALQAALRAEPTPRAAFDRFAARMEAHGFPGVFAGRLSLALLTDLTGDPFAFVNAAEPFIADYLRGGYFSHDPVFAMARVHNRPFRWREATADMTPKQAEVVALFAAQNLTHGLAVPIDSVGGLLGLVTLGRGGEFETSPEALIEIEQLARTLFGHVDAMMRDRPALVSLSQREADVLALVAQGKTNWETGQILGVSEYSVRDYLRTLGDRLQSTNRTQTVVRAVQLGLISV